MSENVTPAQIEAIMRNVVAEENYTITRTFYQIRKKNYIINCYFIQDVLGPMMKSPKRTRTNADIKVAVRAWANPATRALYHSVTKKSFRNEPKGGEQKPRISFCVFFSPCVCPMISG